MQQKPASCQETGGIVGEAFLNSSSMVTSLHSLQKVTRYLPGDNNKVMTKIYEALLVHDGPIPKFELAIPGVSWCHMIDPLMLCLSRKHVEELTLVFCPSAHPELHSSLFSDFPLKRLKLEYCVFRVPSWFVGFSKLTLLELELANLPLDFSEDFLPCCPLLEELRLFNCTAEEHAFVSPSLKVLLFHSPFETIWFKHTPLLSVVSVLGLDTSTYGETSFVEYNPDMVGLFASLPALEHLELGIELLLFLADDGHVPYQLLKPLHNLKFLEVPRILLHRLPQARVLVRLIMSAPNLQTLTIRIDDNDDDHPPSEVVASLQQLLEAENQPGVCCLQHLEELNIQDGRGTQVELDLVRFVLATAPRLRRMSIKPKDNLSPGKVLKFLKEVTLYERISVEAELRFGFVDEDGFDFLVWK